MYRAMRLAAVIACLLPALSRADDAIVVRIRRNQQGDKVKQTHIETESTNTVITDATGAKVAESKASKGINSTYTDEILAKEKGKKATKLARTYDSASMTKDAEEIPVDLKGKTVLVERTGTKHAIKYVNGDEPADKAQQFLREEFRDGQEDDSSDLEAAIVPKDAVKSGTAWKCDMPKLIATFGKSGMTIDATKSTATGKLLRVYQKGNATYGILDVTIDFVITDFGKKATGPQFAKDATMQIKMNMDVCIDGTTTGGKADVTMVLHAYLKVNQNGMDLGIDVVTRRTLKETNELLK